MLRACDFEVDSGHTVCKGDDYRVRVAIMIGIVERYEIFRIGRSARSVIIDHRRRSGCAACPGSKADRVQPNVKCAEPFFKP